MPVGSSFFYLGTAATKDFNHFIIIISAQNKKKRLRQRKTQMETLIHGLYAYSLYVFNDREVIYIFPFFNILSSRSSPLHYITRIRIYNRE